MSDKTTTTLPKYDGDDIFMQAMEGELGNSGAAIARPIMEYVNGQLEDLGVFAGDFDKFAKHFDRQLKADKRTRETYMVSEFIALREEVFSQLHKEMGRIIKSLEGATSTSRVDLVKKNVDVFDKVDAARVTLNRVQSKQPQDITERDLSEIASRLKGVSVSKSDFDTLVKRVDAIEKGLPDLRENAGRGADAYEGLYIDHAPSDAHPNGVKSFTTWRKETDGHIDANAQFIRTLNDNVYGADGALASIDKLKDTVNGKEADGTNPAVPGHEHRITNLERKVNEATSKNELNTSVAVATFVLVTLGVGILIVSTSGFSYGLLFAPLIGAVASIFAATISTGRSRVAGEKEGNHDKR